MYLDNAATTKPGREVIEDIVWCLENAWGNPSSPHSEGVRARQILEESRDRVAEFINADGDEIIFTSSGSESNNLAIKGFLDTNNMYECIITTDMEHPSVFNTCSHLMDNGLYRVCFAPLDNNGKVDVYRFKQLISELSHTYYCFVSIMLANNEIGTINDIKKIASIVHSHEGILHCDATQAIGQIPVDVKELDCDLLTFSSHKVGVPRGTGVLYKKKDVKLSPIILGGHQENGYVAGTENLANIYALGKQLERIGKVKPDYLVRNYILEQIVRNLSDYDIQSNGDFINRLPNNISLTISGVNAEALITLLDMKGIQVSAGSACSSGEKEPSRVLKAIGLSDKDALSTIRISIGKDITIEDCDKFVKALRECLDNLKMMS